MPIKCFAAWLPEKPLPNPKSIPLLLLEGNSAIDVTIRMWVPISQVQQICLLFFGVPGPHSWKYPVQSYPVASSFAYSLFHDLIGGRFYHCCSSLQWVVPWSIPVRWIINGWNKHHSTILVRPIVSWSGMRYASSKLFFGCKRLKYRLTEGGSLELGWQLRVGQGDQPTSKKL